MTRCQSAFIHKRQQYVSEICQRILLPRRQMALYNQSNNLSSNLNSISMHEHDQPIAQFRLFSRCTINCAIRTLCELCAHYAATPSVSFFLSVVWGS